MKTPFDLEQRIMECWCVVEDIDLVYTMVCDDPEFSSMSAEHSDKLSNLLLGLKCLYEAKFARLFNTYEELLRQRVLSFRTTE